MRLLPLAKSPPVALEFERACEREGRPCRLTLRPIRPDDGARLALLFDQMSAAARRQRFHCASRGPSAASLLAMSCVDFEHDSAWVVSRFDGEDESLVAEARWHLDEQNPAGDTAEFALAVSDAFQHQGLGSQLMVLLEQDAAAHGVRCLRGEVLSSNAQMLALMQHLDYELLEERGAAQTVMVEHWLAAPQCRSFWAACSRVWARLCRRAAPRVMLTGPESGAAARSQAACRRS
ncbi:GNAT family N-acetyltransferase [Paucibacter sp. B2R-40]|uniref:GNAT family N-acetyltransferase n=1 Tax=Paucibacter sp. B2R-40 TaxID=2893554 RepID=UPI0021E3C0FE|nr:GNAT family N-acetyltransferase [Paucibacter sp. B2R-40]MCV2356862.1 GNAT family N-acetyltransferase [Paucibacter sp. B2R-40]